MSALIDLTPRAASSATTEPTEATEPAAVVSMDLTIAATRHRQVQERLKALQAEATAARADLQRHLEALRCEQVRSGEAPTSTRIDTLQGNPLTVVWQEVYRAMKGATVKRAQAEGCPVTAVQSVRLRSGLTVQGLRERLGEAVVDKMLPLLVVRLDHQLPKGSAAAAARCFLNGDDTTGESLLDLILATGANPMVRL